MGDGSFGYPNPVQKNGVKVTETCATFLPYSFLNLLLLIMLPFHFINLECDQSI